MSTSLRRPAFVLLWAGQAASQFGSLVGSFAYSLTAILVLHATAGQIAVLNGCTLLPALLAGPLAGYWADRHHRRPLLIAADLGRALALLSIPLAALHGSLTLLQLDAVAVAASALGALFDVSFGAYLPGIAGPGNLLRANSLFRGTAAAAEATGFGVAGVLVQVLTAPIAIAADAVSFLVSALSLAAVRGLDMAADGDQRARLTDILAGWRTVRGDPALLAVTITTAAWALAGNAFGVVVMLFFVHDLHLQPLVMGPIFGIGGVSSALGGLIAGRVVRRFGLRRALIGSMYVDIAGGLAVAVAGGPPALVLILMILGQCPDGGRAIYEITATSMLQKRVPSDVLGRTLAFYRTAETLGMFLGLLAGGILGDRAGLRGTLLLATAVSLLLPLILLRIPAEGTVQTARVRLPVEA